MNGQEVLYSQSSIAITVVLFILMLLSNETGFRIGRRLTRQADGEARSLTGSILASVLGLLALLLGFTFSMSMQRYDARSQALVEEANAIGTASLRTELLAEPFAARAREAMDAYIDLRIEGTSISLVEVHARAAYGERLASQQQVLWQLAVNASRTDPRPLTSGAFLTSINDMIDAEGLRSARLELHVPELVLDLLFLVFIVSGAMLGYACGLGGRRLLIPTSLVALLITLIVFIVIDLDRPRRGVIQVDQSSLLKLSDAARR